MDKSFEQPIASFTLLVTLCCGVTACLATPILASDSTHQTAQTSQASGANSDDQKGSGAPGKAGPGVTAKCEAWSTLLQGTYRYNNNQWGSKKAKGKAEQCLLTREIAGRAEAGWSWNWPGFDASVFAYPEIEFGWKPWTGGKSTDARFPIKVSEVPRIALEYEVETDANGSYDLAPEVWLTNAPGGGQSPDPQSITTEVMFWMDYAAGARPAGKVVETPTLDGVQYELWQEDSIGVDANGKGWRLLSFKSPTIMHKGKISIDLLLKHLIALKLANPNDYLASVEFGNEVMGGSGTTWVKRFDVEVGGTN